MSHLDPVGGRKYPLNDDATKLADATAKKVVKDDQKTTKDTYESWQKQNSVLESAKKAGKFGLQFGEIVVTVMAPSVMKAGNPWTAPKGFGPSWLPIPPALKAVYGLSKLSADVVNDAKTNGEARRQVIHNEYAQVTINKYLLNQGLISQKQYDAAVASMSPEGKQFAHGTSSLDERVEVFERLAKEHGADKTIAADVRMGKAAAIKHDVKTPSELGKAMKDAEFADAYTNNAGFRAGVDAMVDEYANDPSKYQKDVAELSSPPKPPVKG